MHALSAEACSEWAVGQVLQDPRAYGLALEWPRRSGQLVAVSAHSAGGMAAQGEAH